MNTRIINELSKIRFTNFMKGNNSAVFPVLSLKDRYSIRVKKQIYYEGDMLVNDTKIDNVKLTKSDIIDILKDSNADNIKVFNDKTNVVISFDKNH
tara:strand:- start:1350 stop:1637 length:288 start_codon:yes stop_codon:yes gene_type:complete